MLLSWDVMFFSKDFLLSVCVKLAGEVGLFHRIKQLKQLIRHPCSMMQNERIQCALGIRNSPGNIFS